MALQFSNSNVSVLDTSTTVLSSREKRLHAVLTNDSTNTIYLGINAAAELNKGIPLSPGEKIMIDIQDILNSAIYAISAVSDQNLSIFEMYLDAL